jgi:hypothetical protein
MINDHSGRREWLALAPHPPPTPPSLPRPRRRRHLLHPCNLPQPECRSFLAVLLPSPISFQGVAALVALLPILLGREVVGVPRAPLQFLSFANVVRIKGKEPIEAADGPLVGRSF